MDASLTVYMRQPQYATTLKTLQPQAIMLKVETSNNTLRHTYMPLFLSELLRYTRIPLPS